jgi:type II secretory pathway component PulC
MVKQSLKILEDLRLEETLTPLLASERGRYISLVSLALAVILVIWALIGMLSNWRADYKMAYQPLTSAGAANLADETSQIDVIPAQHIFGSAPTEDTDFLPVTSAQLHLTGIIKNEDNQLSRIIISEAGQTGKVYSIGDEVISGIKINAINDDSVVLEHNGRFEKLPLVRTRLNFKEMPQSLWQSGH